MSRSKSVSPALLGGNRMSMSEDSVFQTDLSSDDRRSVTTGNKDFAVSFNLCVPFFFFLQIYQDLLTFECLQNKRLKGHVMIVDPI